MGAGGTIRLPTQSAQTRIYVTLMAKFRGRAIYDFELLIVIDISEWAGDFPSVNRGCMRRKFRLSSVLPFSRTKIPTYYDRIHFTKIVGDEQEGGSDLPLRMRLNPHDR